MSEPLKRQVAELARGLHAAGWVANHDGNASARLADGRRFLATPTAVSKRLVDAHDVLTVDIEGKVLSGRKRLFSEWHLHAAAYRARADVGAVLHAHPPHATTVGLARKQLGVPALPEMVVSLGANLPTIEYALPKSPAQDAALARALGDGDADAVLIAGNGVLTVGVDLEQAYLRMELVEHYARMVVAAAPLGGLGALPADDVKKLLDARTKAGLGKAGRAAVR
ncbi:MAG: class II aldolase/adducin family protein [Deltaproteobacteria bacterium]|nr:class II aldolase/adducin family protein [Deltaproteobacteria bacterium]